MKTYELYFNGSSKPDDRLPHAPSPEHTYADFIQAVYSSGYQLKKSSMKYKKDSVTIEVIGVK